MHGEKIFVLTLMEMFAFTLIWIAINGLDKKTYAKKIATFIISISAITTIMDYYDISGAIVYLITFIILFLLMEMPFKQVLVFYIISMIICFTVQLFLLLIIKLSGLVIANDYTFIFAVIFNVCFIGICFICYIILPFSKLKASIAKTLDEFIYVVLNLLLLLMFMKMGWDNSNNFILGQIIVFLAIIISLIVTNIIFIKMIIGKREQKKVIEIQAQYTPIISNLIEDVKRKQHDFKNHLNTIYGIAQSEDQGISKDSIKEYIKSLNNDLKEIDGLIQLDNRVLAGILYSKLCYADDHGIDFKMEINNQLMNISLQNYQLAEILNNLIDNAFDAIKELKEKTVIVETGFRKDQNFIEVRNNGIPIKYNDIPKIFDKGFSTKGFGGRGYGLYNIKKIVESVNGQIQLSCEEGWVQFKIILKDI
jgi:signal transduction histidine kinase